MLGSFKIVDFNSLLYHVMVFPVETVAADIKSSGIKLISSINQVLSDVVGSFTAWAVTCFAAIV